jgi:hypothetical protein
MQGLVARRGQLAPEAKEARKDATAKLMETAVKMMKNGATPDVVTFIETTITEVNENVLSAIVEEHHRDQRLINDLLDRFDAAVAAMEACAASVEQADIDREAASDAHKLCRSSEAIDCARSRKCEEELEELWDIVKHEEEEMREIHRKIHGEWCVGPEPPQPGLDDPFRWNLEIAKEGPETSQTDGEYPTITYTQELIDFRVFSINQFELYIAQKPLVELAWENYNRKLIECAALEETWTLKVDDCDGLQDTLHDQACMHAGANRQCASNFGHEYHMTMVAYQNAVTTVQQLEYDRKREWETLHIVTCLLETVYTHVIHSIDSGEPCPTTESHPEETEREINYCHVVEESMTANLTIDYGNPPPPPDLPPHVEPPCTAQYIWDESGSFSFEIQASHSQTITDEGLGGYFTILSAFGWAGCAAPKACIPCESTDLIVDPAYIENDVCKHHHGHLNPGAMDWDTFKCLSGDECIKAIGRCNGVSNCDDGSDEVGCDAAWGTAAVLGTQECQEPFISDVQFRCATGGMCAPKAGLCNGVNNCPDGSDEDHCATTTTDITLEAMTGFTATMETPAINSAVFHDRSYVFDSLGSFTGHSFVKMSNEDKHIRHSHVQMKLRLQQPTIVYVAKLDDNELPWLELEGWTLTHLEGVSYHGVRETRHTDWSGNLQEDHYSPGQVWQKTFAAGTVEMRGNNGGDGSYVIFVANLAHPATPPSGTLPGAAEYIGCFIDDSDRDLGTMVGTHDDASTNTFELCRVACGNSKYMSLQWGGECFCADAYGTASQYTQVADSECNMEREPCTPNSHNCGGTWHQAIYQINHAAYHYGEPTGNTCPTSDVSEADCLAAVQMLLPKDQAQGRTNLVAGSWGWVPPGCSVQSHFTHGANGDWAAHYNRNSGGQNDGGYTPVCVSTSPVYTTALADTKCPHEHGDRLFRSPEGGSDQITLDQCYAACATTAGCEHFSWGTFQGGYVCMGCTTLENAQTHVGFTAYDMVNHQ